MEVNAKNKRDSRTNLSNIRACVDFMTTINYTKYFAAFGERELYRST